MQLPNLFNKGDLIDLAYEIRRKGIANVLHRLGFKNRDRVKSNWDCIDPGASDWWIIPTIRKRWNFIISGNENIGYEDHVVAMYFKNKRNLKMISAGCGGGTSEINFAKHDCFSEVRGFDISEKIVAHANKKIEQQGLSNLQFFTADIYKYGFGVEQYDAILFHSSLHHFTQLDAILLKVKKALKPDGILIVNEYVGPNRFQWCKHQLKAVNNLLDKNLPESHKEKRVKGYFKRKVYKPGLVRMFLADPSESVCSAAIPSVIKKHFLPLEEKALGGNLIHPLMKDIAHHYSNNTKENAEILNKLIEEEENFIKIYSENDMLFGVYIKN